MRQIKIRLKLGAKSGVNDQANFYGKTFALLPDPGVVWDAMHGGWRGTSAGRLAAVALIPEGFVPASNASAAATMPEAQLPSAPVNGPGAAAPSAVTAFLGILALLAMTARTVPGVIALLRSSARAAGALPSLVFPERPG